MESKKGILGKHPDSQRPIPSCKFHPQYKYAKPTCSEKFLNLLRSNMNMLWRACAFMKCKKTKIQKFVERNKKLETCKMHCKCDEKMKKKKLTQLLEIDTHSFEEYEFRIQGLF